MLEVFWIPRGLLSRSCEPWGDVGALCVAKPWNEILFWNIELLSQSRINSTNILAYTCHFIEASEWSLMFSDARRFRNMLPGVPRCWQMPQPVYQFTNKVEVSSPRWFMHSRDGLLALRAKAHDILLCHNTWAQSWHDFLSISNEFGVRCQLRKDRLEGRLAPWYSHGMVF